MYFENVFKQIDDRLREDGGCSTALDYVEQSSWILFLKYLDDLESTRELKARLAGQEYSRFIDAPYQWHVWAAPKNERGAIDRTVTMVGDDLLDFVNNRLWPYLAGFRERFPNNTIEFKIGIIFSEIQNKITSGYTLRDVIEHVDQLRFQTAEEKHEMSALYENRLRQMGNAGRNGGEYYTARPLIRTIIRVLDPKIGETFYDGASGSCGFPCEAYLYMHAHTRPGTTDENILQTRTFYAKELKGLAYIIGMMNMILHGIESPNIVKTNTLAENLADIQPKDQVDVIGANPPFGGAEREEIQQNFPIKSSETAYMFLQHFIKMLKPGGRAGIIIKNTFLSNNDNASVALRKKLLTECNLTTVLDLPAGVFTGTGVKTVVLFFRKGEPTKKVWYYQLDKHFTKTHPLTEDDLADFIKLQKSKAEGANSWTIDVEGLDENYDLSVRNPNKVETIDVRTPKEIADEIAKFNLEGQELLNEILKML